MNSGIEDAPSFQVEEYELILGDPIYIGGIRVSTVELGGELYPLGYKVVTSSEYQSLGLRKNPNILTYPVGKWFELAEEEVVGGKGDWGGIWVARIPSKAIEISTYMKKKYGVICVIHPAALGNVLFCNNGRIKTDRVFLFPKTS